MMVFLLINFCAALPLLSTVVVVFLLQHAHYLQDGLVVSVTVAPALSSSSSSSSCFYLKKLDTDNHPLAIYLDDMITATQQNCVVCVCEWTNYIHS